MDDLIAFLRAMLNEDERIAREAVSSTGRWWWDHGTGEMCNDATCPFGELTEEPGPADSHGGTVVMQVHGYDVTDAWQGAAHIARHDPARVLAEVAAKRELLDDLLAEKHTVAEDPWYTCSAATEERDGGQTGDEDLRGGPCDCGRDMRIERRLKLLAAPRREHPEYRAEWRP